MSDQIDVNAIADTLNGKADIDLSNAVSNASAASKAAIVGWGMPDYDSRVSKSINTDITANAYGYVLWKPNDVTASTLKINDFVVAKTGGVISRWADNNCVMFPLSPNDTYIASAGDELYFIPCKGV